MYGYGRADWQNKQKKLIPVPVIFQCKENILWNVETARNEQECRKVHDIYICSYKVLKEHISEIKVSVGLIREGRKQIDWTHGMNRKSWRPAPNGCGLQSPASQPTMFPLEPPGMKGSLSDMFSGLNVPPLETIRASWDEESNCIYQAKNWMNKNIHPPRKRSRALHQLHYPCISTGA